MRAEVWAERLYKYEYEPERIRFEVPVPRRPPTDFADLVIYADETLKSPYFVFECKRADISDPEFAQSIEQACGNRASLGASFCGRFLVLLPLYFALTRFPPGSAIKNPSPPFPNAMARPPSCLFITPNPDRT